eukprot:RCo019298
MAHSHTALVNRVRRVLQGVGVCAVLGGTVYGYHDEGIHRAVLFWSQVGPIYLHYKFTDWNLRLRPEEERDVAFNKLHDRYAPIAQRLVLRLRGFFIKIAQIASTRDDFVPSQYMHFFKKVQDKAPAAFSPSEVARVVEQAYGRPLEAIFETFEPTPCGSAT